MTPKQVNFTPEQRQFLYDLYKECDKHEFCTECCYCYSCLSLDNFTPSDMFSTELEAHYFLEEGRRLIYESNTYNTYGDQLDN